MDKILHVNFITVKDSWGYVRGHELDSPDSEKFAFTAYDLCECPEDATLDRDLFNGYDYLDAIWLGMELAREGYTSIEVTDIEED
nr:MAG TPA: hypothetical protein [Caudoviricetes sp.]